MSAHVDMGIDPSGEVEIEPLVWAEAPAATERVLGGPLDPPFLQERTTPLAAPPEVPRLERLAEMAYRQKAVTAIVVASIVLAALALAYRPPGTSSGNETAGTVAPGQPEPPGALAIQQVLRSVGSSTTIIDTSATPPAPAAPSTDTTSPPATATTVAPTSDTTTSAPATTTATTAPPAPSTTAPATTALPTIPPDNPPFLTLGPTPCVVLIDEPTTVRAEPDDDADALEEVRFGLFTVMDITRSDGRWYQIDTGSTVGWVADDDVDQVGNCRRR